MRNVCLLAAALVATGTAIAPAAREIPAAPVSKNPLIAPWTGPYGGVPPWDKLEPGRFAGAFELAMAEERREIEAIVSNPEAPTFENTIAAMERAGGMRERLEMLFDVTRQNLSTPEHQAVERELRPRLSAAADAIVFNAGLFGRIEAVYRSLPSSRLEPDQKRLVTRIYDQYVRRGATLDQTQKGTLSQINQLCDLHSRAAAITATRTTPRRRPHASSSSGRSGRHSSGTPAMRIGAWPIRWRSIQRMRRRCS
jgi:peptidyl-dipeptidase Dcp